MSRQNMPLTDATGRNSLSCGQFDFPITGMPEATALNTEGDHGDRHGAFGQTFSVSSGSAEKRSATSP